MPKKAKRAARYAELSQRKKAKRPVPVGVRPSDPSSLMRPRKELRAVAPPTVPPRARLLGPDLSLEYRYVLGDLKRIAIISGGLIAAMALLAFLLR